MLWSEMFSTIKQTDAPKCLKCGAVLVPSKTKPRKYCNAKCKQSYYYMKVKNAS